MRPARIALGVLDQSPVPNGSLARTALGNTIELARTAERLGYRRYWLAEHHNTSSLAGTAPEVLAAAVAGCTTSIRVGSGGVLLPYRSPLMVAESFRLLHALFPGRIDLGIGRAAGTDPVAEQALRRGGIELGEELFPQLVAEVVAFLHDRRDVRAMPTGPGAPEVWLLGSSSHSGAVAAKLGLGLVFAHFITSRFGPQIVRAYRQAFQPSELRAAPVASVAVSVVCAATDAEAEQVASTADVWRLGPEGGDRGPIMSPEAAAAHPLTELQRLKLAQSRAKVIVGAPDRVYAAMTALAEEFDVDEVMVVTVCHDHRARLRSYELLAEVFGLETGCPR